MMRALLDTNAVLDFLLDRPTFAEAAAAIWEALVQKRFAGYVAAITPINLFYIARKLKGAEMARATVWPGSSGNVKSAPWIWRRFRLRWPCPSKTMKMRPN
jgi:predicted nucleic acid-binding protein